MNSFSWKNFFFEINEFRLYNHKDVSFIALKRMKRLAVKNCTEKLSDTQLKFILVLEDNTKVLVKPIKYHLILFFFASLDRVL